MTEGDAKEYLAEKDPGWEMPEDWWSVETEANSIHVTEKTARLMLDNSYEVACMANADYYQVIDLYGAECNIKRRAVTLIFHSTRLARAKWVVGMPERNWKADTKPDWEA